jgi:hypothetical protein
MDSLNLLNPQSIPELQALNKSTASTKEIISNHKMAARVRFLRIIEGIAALLVVTFSVMFYKYKEDEKIRKLTQVYVESMLELESISPNEYGNDGTLIVLITDKQGNLKEKIISDTKKKNTTHIKYE